MKKFALTDRIVHRLIDGRLHPSTLLADVVHLRNLPSSEVRQTQIDELALFVQLIHSTERLLEWHGMVRRMQIEDVNAVCAQFFETSLEMLLQPIRLVNASLVRIHLGGESKAAVLPPRLARPCLLLAANVHARCVNLIVALGLEVVEMLGEFVKLCDACSACLVGTWYALVMVLGCRSAKLTECHQSEDDSVFRVLRDERHLGFMSELCSRK